MAGAGTESAGVGMWIERVGNYQQEKIRGEKQKNTYEKEQHMVYGQNPDRGKKLDCLRIIQKKAI